MVLDGGNPDLEPERATSWTAGLELRPAAGVELEASAFKVNYKGRVGFPLTSTLGGFANPLNAALIIRNPTLAQLQAIIATLSQGVANQSGRPLDLTSIAGILDETLRNTAHEHARGIDLAGRYGARLGAGRLSLELAASYLESSRQLAEGQPVLQRAGLIFNPPHWRGRASASWQTPRFGLTALLNHLGSTRDDRFAFEKIGAFNTLDLSARLSGPRDGPLAGWELRLSALNFLAEKPAPIRNTDPTAAPFDSTNQSPVGRFLAVSVRKSW
jgi:outer membrane receptor protein involved in Fe transport